MFADVKNLESKYGIEIGRDHRVISELLYASSLLNWGIEGVS